MDRDRLGHKRHTKEASGIIIANIETEGNVDHCGIKIRDMNHRSPGGGRRGKRKR